MKTHEQTPTPICSDEVLTAIYFDGDHDPLKALKSTLHPETVAQSAENSETTPAEPTLLN